MKTFPIAIASAALGLSFVAGALRTVTAEESASAPGDICVVANVYGVVVCQTRGSSTWYSDCPLSWASGAETDVRLAKIVCVEHEGSGTP